MKLSKSLLLHDAHTMYEEVSVVLSLVEVFRKDLGENWVVPFLKNGNGYNRVVVVEEEFVGIRSHIKDEEGLIVPKSLNFENGRHVSCPAGMAFTAKARLSYLSKPFNTLII